MINVKMVRKDRFGVLSEFDHVFTPERAFESLLQAEIGFGGKIKDVSETFVEVETPVFGKLDVTTYEGTVGEMEKISQAARLWCLLNTNADTNTAINEAATDATLKFCGNPAIPALVAWTSPLMRGAIVSMQIALFCIEKHEDEDWIQWAIEHQGHGRVMHTAFSIIKLALWGDDWGNWARHMAEKMNAYGDEESGKLFSELTDLVLSRDKSVDTPEKATAFAIEIYNLKEPEPAHAS